MTSLARIKSVASERSKELMSESPGVDVTQELLEDRVVLSVIMNNRLVECDFIESKRSCTNPRRTSEYYDVLSQGIKLGVLVPQRELGQEMTKLKRIKGIDRFVVLGYPE
jgi:hypothetical protein